MENKDSKNTVKNVSSKVIANYLFQDGVLLSMEANKLKLNPDKTGRIIILATKKECCQLQYS